jgi:membrane associated rhomboid family serine protease
MSPPSGSLVESLEAGEWWRLITPLFVQPFGWSQFLFNLLFVAALLPIVDRFYGSWCGPCTS